MWEGDDTFLEELERCTLDPGRFNHKAHVWAAWRYIRMCGEALGGQRFEVALTRFARHIGAHQKYHATITHALLRLIASRIRKRPHDAWHDFVANNQDLFASARSVLEIHYSPAVLDAEAARANVVLPDRQPLPGGATDALDGAVHAVQSGVASR
jgi:hypothetical protein